MKKYWLNKKTLQNICGYSLYIALTVGLVIDYLCIFNTINKDVWLEHGFQAILIGLILFSFHFFHLRPSPWFKDKFIDKKEIIRKTKEE